MIQRVSVKGKIESFFDCGHHFSYWRHLQVWYVFPTRSNWLYPATASYGRHEFDLLLLLGGIGGLFLLQNSHRFLWCVHIITIKAWVSHSVYNCCHSHLSPFIIIIIIVLHDIKTCYTHRLTQNFHFPSVEDSSIRPLNEIRQTSLLHDFRYSLIAQHSNDLKSFYAHKGGIISRVDIL